MKILILQDRLRSGGTERQSLFLAHAFTQAGHVARILTFRPGGALAEEGNGLTLEPLQWIDVGLDWFAPGLINRIREFQPEIIMAMGRMANCYAGMVQHNLPRIPVIGTMRTGKRLPWLYQRSLHRVRHVVANSQQAATLLEQRYNLPSAKLSVVHNSLVFTPNLRRATGAPELAIRARLGAERDTLVLLCVAMFRPEKNQRELIEIVQALPAALPWQLWLAGEGSERARCEALTREAGLTSRVRFIGFQNNPQDYYRAADLAVLTSKSESLSNFLIEAQAYGLPTVAYDVQGVRECFLHGVSGFAIPPGDQAAFREAIQVLISQEDLRLRCSAQARFHAAQNFAPEKQAGRYLQLFESIREASR
jgi:glycosyltransferase involved in cell wall biosynthesis